MREWVTVWLSNPDASQTMSRGGEKGRKTKQLNSDVSGETMLVSMHKYEDCQVHINTNMMLNITFFHEDFLKILKQV